MLLFKSEYSIGRSLIQVGPYDASKPTDPASADNLIEIAVNEGLKRVYLVEDSTAGFIPIFKELRKHDIDMCFGWRVSIVEDVTSSEPQTESKVVIFVRSEKGWKKLIKLATYAQTVGKLKEPRLDYKKLHELWHDSLVLVIPFYDSFLARNVMTKNVCVPDFRGIKLHFFVESNDLVFDGLIEEAIRNFDGDTIEAKSIYYSNRADAEIFQARKLMERKTYKGGNLENPNLDFFASDEFCLESAKERTFKKNEAFEALFDEPLRLFLPGIRLPKFVMTEENKKRYSIPEGATNNEILRTLARHGYKKRMEEGDIPKGQERIYADRANYELSIFEQVEYTDYILLVADTMAYVNDNKLAKGLARGSAAGSLINFLLGICEIDPIKHSLYFERFVNPDRAEKLSVEIVDEKTGKSEWVTVLKSAADVDIDLGASAKDQVIAYLQGKYKGSFCKLATFGTYATKAAVKDCMKIIGGFSEDDAQKVSNEVASLFGKIASPEKTYEESELFRNFMDNNPKIYKAVRKIHESKRNVSSHASAFLVCWEPLENVYPLQYGTDNEIISCVDMEVTESMCIKLDLLGLHTISLLENCARSAGVVLKNLDYDSPDIYKHLIKLEYPAWLFQLSGDSLVRSLNRIGVLGNLEILTCILSICRPGCFAFLDQYADFLNGKSEMPVLHPLFQDILEKTSGICLFQETLLELFERLTFSKAEADTIRRLVGKKKKEEMIEWEKKIYDKARENNIDEAAAKVVWDIAIASADYSFNRCLAPETIVWTETGPLMMKEVKVGQSIKAFGISDKKDIFVEVVNIYNNELELFEIEFDDGNTLSCSMDHKLLCEDMIQRPLWKILEENHKIMTK